MVVHALEVKPILVRARALLILVAVGSGACTTHTSSAGVVVPPPSAPPSGLTFTGGKFGGACEGDVYTAAGTGWAFCDNGVWAYTTADPAPYAGFTQLVLDADGGEVVPPPYQGGGQGGGQGGQ
jgi:hypothetical protein